MSDNNQINHAQTTDPIVVFWQHIADKVRETIDPEHYEEHDKFWNDVFADYQNKSQQINEPR